MANYPVTDYTISNLNQMDKTPNKYCVVLICGAMVLVTFFAFEAVRSCGFVFDDKLIFSNQYIKAGLSRDGVIWAFIARFSLSWMPLAWLSHMLDCELFDLNPGWHHLINVLLHIFNTLLLFAVLKKMTGALWRSVFVAAVFALHPVNVQSVVWISARNHILCTMFAFLTIAAYLRYTGRPCASRYLLMLLVFALGLMARPIIVALPFVLLLLDYWPLGRFRFARSVGHEQQKTSRLVLEKLPLLALSAVSIYLSSLSVQHLGIAVSTEFVPMKLRIANALVSYVVYIGKIFRPQNLAVFYPYPEAVPMAQTVGALLLLVCVSVLVIRFFKAAPYLAVGWLWFIGTLVPVIGLVQGGVWPAMADRYIYFPSIGIFIIVAWGAAELSAKRRYLRIGLALSAGLILAMLLICTRMQVRYWHNDLTLFGHAAEVTENNYLAHYNLGNEFRFQGKLDEAMSHYRQALQIRPNYAEAHNNLGGLLLAQGKLDDAVSHFRESLKLRPNNVNTHWNLGKALSSQGKLNEAIGHYRQAIQLQPSYLPPLNQLAWILATAPDPNVRDAEQAIEFAGRAAELTKYQNATILGTLAAAYAAAGQFPAAIETSEKALDLAESTEQKQLAEGIRNRLLLFKAGQAYIGNGK